MAHEDILGTLSRRAIIAIGGVLAAVILGGTALTVYLLRDEALERAEENLSNLVAVLAEQTSRSVQSVDLVVRAAAGDFGSQEIHGRLSGPALHERLRERAAGLPELEGVAVIGRDGELQNHSRRFPPPSANYADRDYFGLHRDGSVSGLHVGVPVMGRIAPGWQQTFSRRISGRGGEFLGVVSAAISIERLHPFYRSLRLGPGGRVTIFRADGVLVNTFPFADGSMGRSYAAHPLFTDFLGKAGAGLLSHTGFVDDEPRLIAYERLRDYPLVVAVSSTERHVLSDWRQGAVTLGAVSGGVCLLIGVAVVLALRQREQSLTLRSEIQISGDRLHGVIQSMMDAVITVDEGQKILLFNAAAERIFGCPASQAVGGPLERFMPERFRAAHRAHIENFGRTGVTTRAMGGSLVLYGLRLDGTEFPIDASISQVTSGGRKLFTVILRDITQRKKAEDALQQAHHERRNAIERLHGVLQSAMDAIITMDEEQRIVLFNEAAEKIFRCRSGDAIGGPLERYIPERFRAAHRAHVQHFGETRVTTRLMGSSLALFGLRADGEEFPIDASISQVTVGGRKLYTVILRDITERQRAEEALARSYRELRDLSAAMNEVREAERTRIAREMHDELAQWLTALKMDISWVAGRFSADQGPLTERTEKMKQLVDATVTSVRRIAADLRPVVLDDLGLVPAIESLLHELSQRTGIVVSLEADTGRLDFGEPLATSIYRMVQEALTNVARHAAATEVRVRMGYERDDLVIRVSDNGKGYDAQGANGKKTYGVLGIRERAQTLGGIAHVARLAAGGTLVEIAIPAARYRGTGAGP